MKAIDFNSSIIEGYFRLLNHLSPGSKRDLISRLTLSIKSDSDERKSSFKKAFNALESGKSADKIISEIRKSKIFNQKTESL